MNTAQRKRLDTIQEILRAVHFPERGPLTFGVVYATAFPDRQTFRRFVVDIAWETKVWIAAEQFGIIHFDLISQAL